MAKVFIGEALIAFKRSRNMSHVQMCKALGIDRQYFSALEQNRKPLTPALSQKLERAFGINVSELMPPSH